MPNRLARESSPYLLQHANNPVDWHPWGEEAFARARSEDKPIFLSIGYSTCHWCHVMEHESFEDAGVAAVVNEHFIPIKVDREERPDVDRVYMLFVQATTGAGGWPMSVWLTPDLKPFYGGTYFPPSSRWGRPGFVEVLTELARLWREERPRLVESAEGVTDRLRSLAGHEPDGGDIVPALDDVQAAARQFRQAFDRRHAGFGGAPKFPRPSELLFLLRAWALGEDDTLRAMVLDTLRAMAFGGMYDHIGGGFHRYSVDAGWRVPHFEKMLYDQAQLVMALLEAGQASGESYYGLVAGETIGYVARDLMHPEGGFYSAEDADSVPPEHAGDPHPHKTEGAFYLWSAVDVERLLGADAEIVSRWYGIEPNGNVAHDPQGEFGSKNIPYIAQSTEDIARRTGRSEDEVMAAIVRGRTTLFDARTSRPRPHLDDKVITAWNGLMVAACARAARVFDGDTTLDGRDARTHYLQLATRAASFVRARLWDQPRGALLRRERAGEAGIDGFAEDYAYFIWGLLELFQTSGEADWLAWAVTLQEAQDRLFWDATHGGWFSTSGRDATVLLRMKEDYDGAEPAASSVAVQNVLALAHLADDATARERAEQTLGRIGARGGDMGRQIPFMLANVAWWHAGVQQVVIVGDPDSDDTRRLRRAAASVYLPFAVHVPIAPGAAHDRLAALLPWVRDLAMRDGRATAYVCRNFACDLPVNDAEALAAQLRTMSDRLPA